MCKVSQLLADGMRAGARSCGGAKGGMRRRREGADAGEHVSGNGEGPHEAGLRGFARGFAKRYFVVVSPCPCMAMVPAAARDPAS